MRTPGLLTALTGIVVGASALTLVSWSAVEGPPPGVDAGATQVATRAHVAELHAMLEDEREARRELAEELESLRDEVARLTVAPQVTDADAADEEDEPEVDETPAVATGGSRFDEASLAQAGWLEREVRWLRERYDQYQLDRLYLRDEGARDGWFGTGRLREERLALKRDLQEELGLEMYDWLLYASGKTNRVFVRSVIAGSAAERAGFLAGDVIVRYAGRPVYEVRDLRRLTTECALEERVFVEVQRGSASLRLSLPCGPLGVRLRAERSAPPAP